MKKLKRIIFMLEDEYGFMLVFSTTPKNCFQDYCFHKKFLNREVGEIMPKTE